MCIDSDNKKLIKKIDIDKNVIDLIDIDKKKYSCKCINSAGLLTLMVEVVTIVREGPAYLPGIGTSRTPGSCNIKFLVILINEKFLVNLCFIYLFLNWDLATSIY